MHDCNATRTFWSKKVFHTDINQSEWHYRTQAKTTAFWAEVQQTTEWKWPSRQNILMNTQTCISFWYTVLEGGVSPELKNILVFFHGKSTNVSNIFLDWQLRFLFALAGLIQGTLKACSTWSRAQWSFLNEVTKMSVFFHHLLWAHKTHVTDHWATQWAV